MPFRLNVVGELFDHFPIQYFSHISLFCLVRFPINSTWDFHLVAILNGYFILFYWKQFSLNVSIIALNKAIIIKKKIITNRIADENFQWKEKKWTDQENIENLREQKQ